MQTDQHWSGGRGRVLYGDLTKLNHFNFFIMTKKSATVSTSFVWDCSFHFDELWKVKDIRPTRQSANRIFKEFKFPAHSYKHRHSVTSFMATFLSSSTNRIEDSSTLYSTINTYFLVNMIMSFPILMEPLKREASLSYWTIIQTPDMKIVSRLVQFSVHGIPFRIKTWKPVTLLHVVG